MPIARRRRSAAKSWAAMSARGGRFALMAACLLLPLVDAVEPALAGVAAAGAPVTVTDNGDGTVTMANGIASIVVITKRGRLRSIGYTHEHGGQVTTSETLLGPDNWYYGGFSLGSGVYEYALATDPRGNGGAYADIKLLSVTADAGTMEIYFSMLRGSPGFYSTAMMTHRKQDQAFEYGAWGVVSRVPPIFNWLSADSRRDFFIGVPSSKGVKVPDSPHEITVVLDGTLQGTYADKFIYGQDHCDLHAWGWSSVGPHGLNIGRWFMTTMEFSNGGPLKRDVSVYPYSELNNSILTGELGQGSDGFLDQGEVWTKTCGPWFTYLNHVPASVTDPKEAAHRLFADAQERAAAEAKQWPYAWFTHDAFVPESGRGAVTGRLVIADPGNPGASATNTWVGLQIQPPTHKGFYDFQKWSKTYQFWAQTDEHGAFAIPHVIPGETYDLWAFGPGAAGTFLSHPLEGGQPPYECDVPATPFHVVVKAGATTALGDVTWTPVRVGATVFELGTPNRKADEFRHGDDYWNPGTPPKLGFPTPVWGGQMEFPLDFPQGMTYVVGESQWPTDWNYVLPAMADPTGAYQPCTGTIVFTLAQAPADDARASLYLGLAGNDGKRVLVHLNDVDLGTAPGVTGVPNALSADGFAPAYSDTSSIHFGDHGPFCDERIAFPGKLLRRGRNTLTITMDSRRMTDYLMVDYLRLELAGYVPPAPAEVAAYAGERRVLVTWPATPGATGYDVLRSTAKDSGFATVATGLVGPVCGSGSGRATWTDTTVADGTTYFYAVQALNPGGRSAPSPSSAPAAPSVAHGAAASAAPPAPRDLRVTRSGHHQVALSWTPAPGADLHSVWRATLRSDNLGGEYALPRAILAGTTAGAEFVDTTPTDGRRYRYQVTATSAAGTGEPSEAVTAMPLPAPPATAPQPIVAGWKKFKDGAGITLSWPAVPGAAGYVIYRSTAAGETFAWPGDFHTALVETTWFDKGDTDKNAKVKGLDPTREYRYQVTAVNAGGVSPSATIRVPAR
jgi:hypothetical protein